MNIHLIAPPTDISLTDSRAGQRLQDSHRESHQTDRFDRIFQQALNHVNDTQLDAGQQMVALESGKDNLMETVLAIQKASQTMNMMIQVRNRLVDGYQEIFSQQI